MWNKKPWVDSKIRNFDYIADHLFTDADKETLGNLADNPLPIASSEDAGKILTVNNSGEWTIDGTKIWTYAGKIVTGEESSLEGYGRVTVTYIGGIYRVDFSLRITTAAAAGESSNYRWGLDRELLTTTIGKTINFVPGGVWYPINSSGNIIYADIEYGTSFTISSAPEVGGRWAIPGRMYRIDGTGDLASYPATKYAIGTNIQGTAYAID